MNWKDDEARADAARTGTGWFWRIVFVAFAIGMALLWFGIPFGIEELRDIIFAPRL